MTDPTLNSTQDNAHPDTLLSALQRYHSGGDKTQLRAALQRYNNRFSGPPHISKRRIILDAFSSFTLFPVRSYQRNLPVRKHQSGAEAIASYWRATGEYLSHAMIQHILNEEDKTNGA